MNKAITLIVILSINIGFIKAQIQNTKPKVIIIDSYPKEVPLNKKWVIPTGKELIVELSDNALRTRNVCGALLQSTPRVIPGISEGDYGNPHEIYALILDSDLSKIAYANDYTYQIKITGIVDHSVSLYDVFRGKTPEEIVNTGEKEIVFYAGKKISAGTCLTSLQVLEYDSNDKTK